MALRKAALLSVGLAGAEATGAMPLVTGDWVKINSASKVAGTVTISQRTSADKTQSMHVAVTGISADCPTPATSPKDGKCAVLLYEGKCKAKLDSNDKFVKDWYLGHAEATKTTVSQDPGTETPSGKKMSELKSGHFIVVKDKDDKELACAPLAPFTGGKVKAGEIKLAKHDKEKTVGKAKVTWDGAKQVAQLEITEEGDDKCAGESSGCRIYVSKAEKCDKSADADLKKKHSDKFEAQYIVASKKAKMSTHVMDMTADDATKMIGKALVLTNDGGDIVSCGLITKEAASGSGASSLVAGPMAGFLALVAALWTGA